jgi:glycosyltransferase involved in cell wall biosynthesis
MTDAVAFPGWVTDSADPGPILELINTATIVVMPSRWKEPFGLVALQGSQMARPVVATRTGGLQEIIDDGETGILFERDDHEACTKAILSLLDDPARAVAMGQAGRVRAEERFGWTRYVDAYDQLCQRLVREHEAAAGNGQADG